MTVTVNERNDTPTVENEISDQTATEDSSFSFTIPSNTFDDLDQDTLTLSSDIPGGSWLSLNSASGVISGTPANSDVGTHSITVTASDGRGASVSDAFVITVNNENDAPVVTLGGTSSGDFVEDNGLDLRVNDVAFTATGTNLSDIDVGDELISLQVTYPDNLSVDDEIRIRDGISTDNDTVIALSSSGVTSGSTTVNSVLMILL